MPFVQNFKEGIGKMLYRQRLKKMARTRKVHSFSEAETIGIIYDATEKESHEMVKTFVKYLRDMDKRVTSLGFVNTRYPSYLLSPKLDIRFFTVKELNFFSIPACTETKNFINEEFNILVDLNLNGSFPLQYICGLSKANFKVGITSNNQDIYDMMLHIEKKKTLENLIMQVTHYLNMINRPAVAN